MGKLKLGSLALAALLYGSPTVDAVYLGTDAVYHNYAGTTSPVTITATTTLTAGIDFPHDTDVTVTAIAGGGSGACNNGSAGGGYAGEVVTTVVNLPYGEQVVCTIGAGGPYVQYPYKNGIAGGNTSFGSYLTAIGGAGGIKSSAYYGNNGVKTTDAGTANDGVRAVSGAIYGWGGESSGASNGGNGVTVYNAANGGVGSGGGGQGYGNLSYHSGSGGRGEIRLSW